MTLATLRKTGLLLLFIVMAGCSGDSTSSYDFTNTTTVKARERVVNGLVYGNAGKELVRITSDHASPQRIFTAFGSGQYAISDFPLEFIDYDNIFYATFADRSILHSVWSGVPTPTADITTISHQQGAVTPSNVTVDPDNFAARANINPITDLAYWYWLYDNQQSPYYYYLTSVFLFFKERYFLPEQDAVHDYPSPELLRMFSEIQIQLMTDPPAVNPTGFNLISIDTGRTVCKATFAQFPICR